MLMLPLSTGRVAVKSPKVHGLTPEPLMRILSPVPPGRPERPQATIDGAAMVTARLWHSSASSSGVRPRSSSGGCLAR